MTDAKPVPDAPGRTPPATPAHGPTLQEAQATISDHYGHGWLAGRDADRQAIVALRAEVARLTQKLDISKQQTTYWHTQAEAWQRQSNSNMALMYEAEARLTAQTAILYDLLVRLRSAHPESIGSIDSHRSARYSRDEIDRLAALRTPHEK